MQATSKTRALTGLERDLVLQYLKDGNVPVTIANLDETNTRGVAVFPVAVNSSKLKVLDKGVIVLQDAFGGVNNFLGHDIKCQFYFNNLCLYFMTKLLKSMSKIYFQVPQQIFVAQDKTKTTTKVNAVLRFTGPENALFCLKANAAPDTDVFEMPKWGDIDIENQKAAKTYLEGFIQKQKTNDIKFSNGVYLLSICKYFFTKPPASLNEANAPLDILFIDSEKIIFGKKNSFLDLQEKEDYMLQLYINTGVASVPQRQIIAHCKVQKIYCADKDPFYAAVCYFADLKEEDERFLYEKSTGKLFC